MRYWLSGRYLWALLSVTVGAYVGTLALSGVLLYFFHPAGAGDCSFNVSMIALTLLVGLTMSALSMSSWVRAAPFSALPPFPALPITGALIRKYAIFPTYYKQP